MPTSNAAWPGSAKAVAAAPFAVAAGQSLRVTCSLGVVRLRSEMNVLSLVDAADQALLDAKRTGKNRVVLAS